MFTTSPLAMLQAEADHRRHAIVEQVIADLKNGPLAHLPSGVFNANAAWLVCATIAFNLTRTAGALASTFHAKATTATIRDHLIDVPARIARTARRLILHLPQDWPWETAWTALHGRRQQAPTGTGHHLTTQPQNGRNRRPQHGKAGQTGRSAMPTPRTTPENADQPQPDRQPVDPGSGGAKSRGDQSQIGREAHA